MTTDRFSAPFTASTERKTSPLRSRRAAHSAVAQKSRREIEQGVLVRRADRAIGDSSSSPRLVATTRSVRVFTFSEEGLVDLEDVRVDSTQRELAAHDALLEQRDHRLRVDAR